MTQGPLAHTVVDMWRLVLQERAPAIVMITRLKEKQRVKCEPYVPAHTATYGDITVTVRQVIVKSGYTIRQLSLQVRCSGVPAYLYFSFGFMSQEINYVEQKIPIPRLTSEISTVGKYAASTQPSEVRLPAGVPQVHWVKQQGSNTFNELLFIRFWLTLSSTNL